MENGKMDREWGMAVKQILGHHTNTMNEKVHIRDTNKGILYLHNDA